MGRSIRKGAHLGTGHIQKMGVRIGTIGNAFVEVGPAIEHRDFPRFSDLAYQVYSNHCTAKPCAYDTYVSHTLKFNSYWIWFYGLVMWKSFCGFLITNRWCLNDSIPLIPVGCCS